VDYFQVLAMFARAKFDWPPQLVVLFRYLSIFNFNVELTAPECSFDVTYKEKWMFIEGLPLAALVLFGMLHCWLWFYKRVIKQRTKKLHSHVSALVGTALTMLYYLFMNITRTTLDVFNCSPTDPPDGFEYLEAVFVRCNEPGGLHLSLLPLAVVTLGLYTIAYPGLVAWILFKFRVEIREDQYLRAKSVGDTRLTNPRAYDVRKRFHKLYYQFKPEHWYWTVAILVRKFLIAFTSLMFRKSPEFQLAMALLVIFVSYVLQVRNRPYMSMSEHEDVLENLERSAVREKYNLSVAQALAAAGQGPPVSAAQLRTPYRIMAERVKSVESSVSRRKTVSARSRAARAQAFFWNYNTVESTLLACAVLVCLAGIMLASGRFKLTDESGALYYETQRDTITWITIMVVSFSILYFFAVFASELMSTLAPNAMSRRSKQMRRKSEMQKATAASAGVVDTEGMELARVETSSAAADEFAMNPMFSGSSTAKELAAMASSDPSDRAKWGLDQYRLEYERLRTSVDTLVQDNEKLVTELRNAKKSGTTAARGLDAYAAAKPAVPAARGPSKKQFAQVRTGSVSEAVDAAGESAAGGAAQIDEWQPVINPADGRTYYVNIRTRETSWTKPAALV